MCHEGEVFSAEDGFKKSLGGGLSSAVVDCSFCGRESFLLVGVVVREGWVSCLSSGFEERCIERIFVLRAGDAEFSFSAAPVLCGCVVLRSGFDFLEVREDMGAVPSFSAEFFPCIEVFGVSSDEDHAVDGGGSSEEFSSGAGEFSVIEIFFGECFVSPVVFSHGHGVRECGGHLDEGGGIVVVTLFYEEDGVLGGCGEAISENATCGACADDDVGVGGGEHGGRVAHGLGCFFGNCLLSGVCLCLSALFKERTSQRQTRFL